MKIAAKTKDCRLVVTVKTTSREIIDEQDLNRFSRMYMRCFLKPRLTKTDVIEYTGPVAVALRERMKKPISKRDFLFILEYIVVASQKLQAHNFPLNNLRMNMENIYINETTKELQFLYTPVMGVSDNGNLVDLFREVTSSARPVQESDTGYIARFGHLLNALYVLDLNRIEQFVHREDRTVVSTVKKNNVGQSGFITTDHQRYRAHMAAQQAQMEDDDSTGLLHEEAPLYDAVRSPYTEPETAPAYSFAAHDEDSTGLLYEEEPVYDPVPRAYAEPETAPAYSFAAHDEDSTGLLYEEAPVYPAANEGIAEPVAAPEMAPTYSYAEEDATGLLIEPEESTPVSVTDEEDGTCLLQETPEPRLQSKPVVVFPELRRVLTGETVKINKPVFRIGKERSYVDYFVASNNAISRSHADIITRESGYFVVDLNSKNRTYINNVVLAVQEETQIRNGDILRLANEEFEFRTRSSAAALLVCPNCKATVKQTSKFCSSCGCRL